MEGTPRYATRYVNPEDYPYLAKIERLAWGHPLTQADLRSMQKRESVVGIVAVVGKRVVGHAWYEGMPDYLQLLHVAVAPAFRKTGVGAALLDRVKKKVTPRRPQIILHCRETNLPAQLFLSRQGFVADTVFRKWYEDTGEDAFRMVYEVKK